MIRAVLNQTLREVRSVRESLFGLEIPSDCPGVPSEILNPRNTWKDGVAYDEAARDLAAQFKKNFGRFVQEVPEEIRSAGPPI